MHALGRQGVQVGGQGGNQRLAFAGAHLGNLALVKRDTADELDVEMTQTQRALSRLADGGKGLRQQVVGGLAGGEAFTEGRRQRGEVLVLNQLHLRFERIGSVNQALVQAQQPLVAATKEAGEELEHDEESFRQGMEAT